MIDAWYRFPALRIAVVVGAVVVVALLVWALLIRDEGEDGPDGAASAQPTLATEKDLADLSEELGQPIYWVGQQNGTQLELTALSDGSVYVRYLGEDDAIGDPAPEFLTIGTYPLEDPYGTLQELGELEGSTLEMLDDGGIAVQTDQAPGSVYVAYPDEPVQVEVYDPRAQRALQLATSDELTALE